MRLLGAALLLLIVVCLNCMLGTRLEFGGEPVPALGRLLSPQEGLWRRPPVAEGAPIRLQGLSAPVEVVWDDSGVPHLFAANDSDLYRAQGFIVASQRLWQMDFIALAASGRVSEVVGERALEFDRAQRRKGMVIGAEASFAAMMADSVMAPLMTAYADGVDQFIASLRYRDLPIEYKLLGHRPGKWSPMRSALIQQYMTDNLSGWDRDVEDSHALAVLGPRLFGILFPERPPGIEPVVPTDRPWPFTPGTVPAPPTYDPGTGYPIDPWRPDPANGSNNWAVHGSRTVHGHALLANDTHLGLNLPPIWVPMQLATPGHRVFGFTIPGACGIVNGHNEHAAWGVTNAPRDTRDWYRITWRDSTRTAYLHDGRWLPVEYRVEEIKVRGARTVVDSIRLTIHGPVVHDERFGDASGREHLALRWLGHDASRTQKALYLMNRVKSHTEHVEALRYFDAPAQNWAFASVDGTISMRVQGRFPNKWRGQGRFVLDGTDPAHLWRGWVPFEHAATHVDPARGFVSSANQHSVDEGYPYWTYNAHNDYHRGRRINAVLDASSRFSVEDMMALQHDALDLKAAEGLAALLPLLDTTGLADDALDVLSSLRDWDHVICHDREEPALFLLWYDSVRTAMSPSAMGGARLRNDPPMVEPNSYNTTRILTDTALLAEVERGLGLDARAIVRRAFDAMMERRRAEGPILWGGLNNARVTHLARLRGFGREGLPVDGSGTCVNAQRGSHGPSQRFVVELSSPPRAWFQLPGGVSGDPGSPRYDDLLDEWMTMTYREVRFLMNATEGTKAGYPITILAP